MTSTVRVGAHIIKIHRKYFFMGLVLGSFALNLFTDSKILIAIILPFGFSF